MPEISKDRKGRIISKSYDIKEDLDKVTEHRSIVLIGHLYITFRVDGILTLYFTGIRDSEIGVYHIHERQFEEFILDNIPFRRKLEILFKLELIDEDLKDKLEKINKNRNKVAHDLDYKLTKADCEIYKDKCIKYYHKLFQIQMDYFGRMEIRNLKIFE